MNNRRAIHVLASTLIFTGFLCHIFPTILKDTPVLLVAIGIILAFVNLVIPEIRTLEITIEEPEEEE
jgi:hypothetical protein